MNLRHRIHRFNEHIALMGTNAFSTMWMCWSFMLWGLLGMLPGVPSDFKNFVLLVSSAWIQLWALPLIAVGNMVSNRASEKRAKEDHRVLLAQFSILQQEHADRKAEMTLMRKEMALLHVIVNKLDELLQR